MTIWALQRKLKRQKDSISIRFSLVNVTITNKLKRDETLLFTINCKTI